MRRCLSILSVLTALVLAPAEGHSQALFLQIASGRVTLQATDVSIQEILGRWGEITSATIVNANQLSDARVSLQLDDVPESIALATLLRGAAGYVLTRRAEGTSVRGSIDRIVILARSAATDGTTATTIRSEALSSEVPTARTALGIDRSSQIARGADEPSFASGNSLARAADPAAGSAAINSVGTTQPRTSESDAVAISQALRVSRGLPPLQIPGVVSGDEIPDNSQESLSTVLPAPSKEPTGTPVAPNPFGIKRGAERPGPPTPSTSNPAGK